MKKWWCQEIYLLWYKLHKQSLLFTYWIMNIFFKCFNKFTIPSFQYFYLRLIPHWYHYVTFNHYYWVSAMLTLLFFLNFVLYIKQIKHRTIKPTPNYLYFNFLQKNVITISNCFLIINSSNNENYKLTIIIIFFIKHTSISIFFNIWFLTYLLNLYTWLEITLYNNRIFIIYLVLSGLTCFSYLLLNNCNIYLLYINDFVY